MVDQKAIIHDGNICSIHAPWHRSN